MLYLSEREVAGIIGGDVSWCADAIEKMFETIARGDHAMGGELNASHGMRMAYDAGSGERLFIAMPAYLGEPFSVAGAKWHGPNAMLPGMSTDTHYLLVLNDKDTGVPFAVMPAVTITTVRTACVSIAAARALVRGEPEALGIVGPGKINTIVAEGLISNFPSIKKIFVKGRGEASLSSFAARMNAAHPSVEVVRASSLKDAIAPSDVVSFNTGFVFDDIGDMPMVRGAWIKPRSVFLCSAFAHFPDSVIIGGSTKVCDLFAQYESYEKELQYPAYKKFGTIGNRFADLVIEGKLRREEIFDLSEIISKSRIPQRGDEPVIFSSGGLAVEDIALGVEIYRRAVERGVGTKLED